MLHRSRLLLIMLLLLGLLAACGSPQTVEDTEDNAEVEVVEENNEESSVEEQEPTPTVVPTPTVAAPALIEGPSKAVYSVGDTARLDEFLVRVDEVKLTNETESGKPTEGNQFLLVSVSLENTSNASQSVSTLLQMRALDVAGKEFPMDVSASLTFLDLNGAINAGELATGTVGYQVPIDAKGLQWTFVTVEPDAAQTLKEKGRVVFNLAQ